MIDSKLCDCESSKDGPHSELERRRRDSVVVVDMVTSLCVVAVCGPTVCHSCVPIRA